MICPALPYERAPEAFTLTVLPGLLKFGVVEDVVAFHSDLDAALAIVVAKLEVLGEDEVGVDLTWSMEAVT